MTETGEGFIALELKDDGVLDVVDAPAPETLRAVELCIGTLRGDPRTVDAVSALENVLPMLAAANGVDPRQFPIWDVFQAVSDAWSSAVVRAHHEATGATPFDLSTVPSE